MFPMLLCVAGVVVILADAFAYNEAGGYVLGAAMIALGLWLAHRERAARRRPPPV